MFDAYFISTSQIESSEKPEQSPFGFCINEDEFNKNFNNVFTHSEKDYQMVDLPIQNQSKEIYSKELLEKQLPQDNHETQSTNSSIKSKQTLRTIKSINTINTVNSNTNSFLDVETCTESNKKDPKQVENDNSLLKKKKGRPINDPKIIVEKENKYDPNENITEYMKARKKIQNRESQQRTRQRKKESQMVIFNEIEDLKKENYRLYHENLNLKEDRSFLMEQIRFLQGLIKSNTSNKLCTELKDREYFNYGDSLAERQIKDIELLSTPLSSTSESPSYSLNYQKRGKMSQIFSISILCVLGILCMAVNLDFIYDNTGSQGVISLSNENLMRLNSEDTINSPNDNRFSLFTKGFTIVVFIYACFRILLYKDKGSKVKKQK